MELYYSGQRIKLGYLAGKQVYRDVLFPVYDRTKLDVEHAQVVDRRMQDGTATDAEREAWFAGMKGTLRVSDVNRIEQNTALLHDRLAGLGYHANVQIKTDWTEFDFPKQGEIDRIRHNVDALQTGFYLLPDWREIVYNATLDATQVNVLEWDLHALDVWLVRMTQVFCYSGEIFAGEVF